MSRSKIIKISGLIILLLIILLVVKLKNKEDISKQGIKQTTTYETKTNEAASSETLCSSEVYDSDFDKDGFLSDERLHRNQEMYFEKFTLTKIVADQERYYEFKTTIDNNELIAKVNKEETKVNLSYKGNTTEFEIPFMFCGTSACATMDLMDLTSDGKPEFIYWYSFGTGSWENRCTIYDLDTLKPYEVVTDVSDVISQLKIEPIAIITDRESILTKVTDTYDNTYLIENCRNNDNTITKINQYKFNVDNIAVSIDAYDNKISAYVGMALENASPSQYLGAIMCPYIFDEKEKIFKPDGTMSDFDIYECPIIMKMEETDKNELNKRSFYVTNNLNDTITVEKVLYVKKWNEDDILDIVDHAIPDNQYEIALTIEPNQTVSFEIDLTGCEFDTEESSYRLYVLAKTSDKYGNTEFTIYCPCY